MSLSKRIFNFIGVYPIIDHYYEPLFNPEHITKSLRIDRNLPGIILNIESQINLLKKYNYNDELIDFPLERKGKLEFYYHNKGFEAGDAEYLFNVIRFFKPKRIIEIGSGNSTLMAISAINKNKIDNKSYECEHICIEPYEMRWLEQKNVKVIREKVENIDKSIFLELKQNDILFVDSSHIIRPQGDVLYEYLEIFPILNTGVLIHIHDIFTPKDYPNDWILKEVRFWNEQYLLEAFLSNTNNFEVIASLNFLKHNYFDELSSVCPILKKEPHAEPGSFWILKK